MKTIKLLLVFLLAFCLNPFYAAAQDSQGTNFWLTFPGNLSSATLPLYISSDVNTSGTVSVPGLSFTQNFTVTAGVITTVNLPSSASVTSSDIVMNRGIHVTSVDDISVYGFSVVQFTTDAFLAFPTDALGSEYIILGYKNTNIVNGTQFGIVAAETGTTTVTITPTISTGSRTAGVPYQVVLTQGQAYMLRNTGSSPNDLSGTTISSDKNIAVFGGHQCANVPNGTTLYCDYLVEQLPPLSSWGVEFATVPLASRIGGDTYRILAQENNTAVSLNGSLVVTLNKGQIHEQIIGGYNVISATKPVLVGQYSNGGTFDDVANADPFYLLVPPTDQYLTNYTVNTGTPNIPVNFINIISLTAATNSVLVDGAAAVGTWTPIGGSAFSGIQVSTTVGQHNVSSTLPIGVFVYGFGIDDSYGYLGGQSFSPVATVSSFSLDLQQSIAYQSQEKCVKATVLDQNNNPVIGVKVDFDVIGTNAQSSFGNTDNNGVIEFCYNVCLAGFDTVIATIAGLSDSTLITILPSSLSASPLASNVLLGNQHCVSATVLDGTNQPVENAAVLFDLTGANTMNQSILTNASGVATFCYTPINNGSDTISISAGCTNGNSVEALVTVLPNASPCGVSNIAMTFKPTGLNSIWANQGLNDPYTFYLGISQWKHLSANVTGGTGPFTYAWRNSENYLMKPNGANPLKQSLFEAQTSSYVILDVTDLGNNGCVTSDSVYIPIDSTYWCGNAQNYWMLTVCQNGVTQCVPWATAKSIIASNTGTLGPCPTPKTLNYANDIVLYPNPSAGFASVMWPSTAEIEAEVLVTDVQGKMIQQEKINLSEGQNYYHLDLTTMPNGIYLVRLATKNEVVVKRMTIQK